MEFREDFLNYCYQNRIDPENLTEDELQSIADDMAIEETDRNFNFTERINYGKRYKNY